MGLTGSSTGLKAFDTGLKIKKNSSDDKIVAVAGNPNVGKSTVFNALTGLNQHTGNWSGKTVSNAQGYFKYKNQGYVLVDIPGCYSINAHSAEEEVARDFICFENPDAVVIVCDATCLERNLNLVIQILEITDRAVLCVNLIDEAEKKGIEINFKALSDLLKIPVVPTSARSGTGLENLKNQLDGIFNDDSQCSPFRQIYSDDIEKSIEMLMPHISRYSDSDRFSRWLSLKLLENDVSLISSVNVFSGINLKNDEVLCSNLKNAYDYLKSTGLSIPDIKDEIVSSVIHSAEDIFKKTVVMPDNSYSSRDRRIDSILTDKKSGMLIMLAMLMAVFWITIVGANYPSSFLQNIFMHFEELLFNSAISAHLPLWLADMTVHGVYRVLSWIVAVMLPPMTIFFILFTIMEDLGYLPRVAFNLDKCFKKCNACGKQCLTMCMGFGCNASGVVGCRIIDSPRERLIAMITNSFVPCNGRFPMIITIISMYFIGSSTGIKGSLLSALLLTGVIVLGIIMTFLSSKILSKTVLKGVPSSFTLELPPYRKPQILKVIIRSISDRVIFVLGRAVTSAIPAGIIIWVMANVCIGDVSVLNLFSEFLDPFAEFIGLDGVILMAFILGMPANEIVIPIIIMAYTAGGKLVEFDDVNILKSLFDENGWNWITAVSTVLFSLFHWPCMTTLMTIKKESGSMKWTLVSFILPTVTGIAVCGLFANIARLFI